MSATFSFMFNVAGDLTYLQAPPQPCSIKYKTDSDNTEIDKSNNNHNNNNNNNNNNKNNNNFYLFCLSARNALQNVRD